MCYLVCQYAQNNMLLYRRFLFIFVVCYIYKCYLIRQYRPWPLFVCRCTVGMENRETVFIHPCRSDNQNNTWKHLHSWTARRTTKQSVFALGIGHFIFANRTNYWCIHFCVFLCVLYLNNLIVNKVYKKELSW